MRFEGQGAQRGRAADVPSLGPCMLTPVPLNGLEPLTPGGRQTQTGQRSPFHRLRSFAWQHQAALPDAASGIAAVLTIPAARPISIRISRDTYAACLRRWLRRAGRATR